MLSIAQTSITKTCRPTLASRERYLEQRKIGLDYLRAAAILCVLTAHTAGDHALGSLGFIGVEIFFVLSGYLIGGILLQSFERGADLPLVPTIRNFWVRRWLRTLPNYFLFFPLYMLADRWGSKRRLLEYATFTQNLAWPTPRFYGVSWSLTIEEWFYLLLPILLAMGVKAFGRIRPAILFGIAVMFLVPLALRLTVAQGHPFDAGMRKVVVFRLDSLMWGVALAVLRRYRPRMFSGLCHPLMVAPGLALMAATSWWVWERYRHDRAFTATVGGAVILTAASAGCAMVLPYCTTLVWKQHWFNRCAYLISLWSYSMYLSHGLFIHLSGNFFHDGDLNRPVAIAAAWVLTLAVSAAVFYGFELPILRWRDHMTRHRVLVAPAPVLG